MGARWLSTSENVFDDFSGEVLFEDDEAEVITKRCSEAIVTIREGMNFAGQAISTALVPPYKGVANVDHVHFYGASTACFCPGPRLQ